MLPPTRRMHRNFCFIFLFLDDLLKIAESMRSQYAESFQAINNFMNEGDQG